MHRKTSDALFYAATQQAEWRPVDIRIDRPSVFEADQTKEATDALATVRTRHTGISRGTERLVFNNQIPSSERERMRAPLQIGSFPYPVAYGYAAVGDVETGPAALVGKTVFCLAPHMTHFCVISDWLHVLPADLPPRRAVLAANMETALNGVWDSGVGPCDRVIVVGAGVLGLLLTGLLAQIPGVAPVVVDVRADRAEVVAELGGTFIPAEALAETPDAAFDVAFHTSASATGLATAMSKLGMEGRLVELSWYGDAAPPTPLGGAFHALRLQLISSQVGTVATSRRPRWSHADRMRAALKLLCDPRFDALITRDVAHTDLPRHLPAILGPDAGGLATVVNYPS